MQASENRPTSRLERKAFHRVECNLEWWHDSARRDPRPRVHIDGFVAASAHTILVGAAKLEAADKRAKVVRGHEEASADWTRATSVDTTTGLLCVVGIYPPAHACSSSR